MTNPTNPTREVGNDSIVVAGAAAEGYGVYAGLKHGTGPMTMERYTDLCDRGGIPEEWRLPAKGAKTQLTRAVRTVAGRNRLLHRPGTRLLTEVRPYAVRLLLIGALAPQVEAEPAGNVTLDTDQANDVSSDTDTDAVIRAALDGDDTTANDAPSAGDSLVGQAYGTILLQVTLYDEPSADGQTRVQNIDYRGDQALADLVRAEYARNVGGQVFETADITGWINRTLQVHCEGVMSGPAWYIAREYRAQAEALTEAFATYGQWGSGWFDPPVPCATSAQLGVGMAKSLCAELGVHLGELATAREEAQAKGNEDITPKKAEGFAIRLARVKKRIDFHAGTLGPQAHAECIAAYDDAMICLDSALQGGATTADGQVRDLLKEQAAALQAEYLAAVAKAEQQASEKAARAEALATLIPLEQREQYDLPGIGVVVMDEERTSDVEVTDAPGYL